jgi:hypothetical protein
MRAPPARSDGPQTMTKHQQVFTIQPRQWFAWQVLPGYGGGTEFAPYYAPIYVQRITPMRSGIPNAAALTKGRVERQYGQWRSEEGAGAPARVAGRLCRCRPIIAASTLNELQTMVR